MKFEAGRIVLLRKSETVETTEEQMDTTNRSISTQIAIPHAELVARSCRERRETLIRKMCSRCSRFLEGIRGI